MTLALDGWIWTSALGFGMLGMSVGRLVASAPPAPLPKVGRFQKERDRFRAEGAWAAGLLVVLQAFSAALWSVVPLKGLPVRYLNWQEHQLRLAGFPMGLSPREVPVLCLMTGLLSGAFVSALGSSTVASISVLLVGLALPIFRIQGLRGARVRAAAREVPRTMDLLSLCMSAGMDLVSGLKEVSKGDKGVVADELRYLLAALEMGQTRRAALQEFSENLPALEVGDFTPRRHSGRGQGSLCPRCALEPSDHESATPERSGRRVGRAGGSPADAADHDARGVRVASDRRTSPR
ncbi:MAG: hypothetical protein B6A08_16485 [Sorangiineae bacterium NIC37A_2]|nr:MAG: hypothetical protein B6A08_16485 [Sorangiineae bacterium NIC37A_2]